MVDPDRLATLLHLHPDCTVVNYLVNGFRTGFSLMCSAPLRNYDATNLKSARDMLHILIQKINKEIKLGRVKGPYKIQPLPYLFTNALGLVPKANQPNKWHLVTDMSSLHDPNNPSINSFIIQEDTTVHYRSFDEVLKLGRSHGPGCYMAKSDLDSAFCCIPMDRASLPFMGMLVQGNYYLDLFFPFLHHHVHINSSACKDLAMWSNFLADIRCLHPVPSFKPIESLECVVFIDSSKKEGKWVQHIF